jgi:HAD superfamily hydrolase (TIGR01509 family)
VLKLDDFDAVIFDMDGLVLDTESTYIMAWRQAAQLMGAELDEDFWQSLSGLHHADIEQQLLTHYGVYFDLARFNQLSANSWREYVSSHGITVKTGFAELLAIIKQQSMPYGLATNSPAVNTFECLELAGISDAFSVIVTRDDVQRGKPAPDIFLTVADNLQVNIKRCLVLEDSSAGILAAASAGAFSIYIPSTRPIDRQVVKLSNLVVNDMADLARMVTRD